MPPAPGLIPINTNYPLQPNKPGETGMLAGLAMALAAGFLFGANDVLVRLAALGYRKEQVHLASLLLGTPLLLSSGLLLGESLPPPREAVLYALVGLMHFVVGRHLMYTAIVGLGASAAAAATAPTVVLSALLAWLFLGEPVSPLLALALMLATLSVILAAVRPSGGEMQGVSRTRGLASAVGASLVFASTAVIIRSASLSAGSPVMGAGISYAAALLIFLPLQRLITPSQGMGVPGAGGRAFLALVSSAVAVTFAQLLRYTALSMVPVAYVSLLISLFPLHALVVARLLGGAAGERVGLPQAAAAVLGVLSSLLVFWEAVGA